MEPIQSGQEEDLPRSQDLEELLADAREDAGVLAVLLYGSAARGEATSSSDLDVCLILSPDLEPDEPAALSRKRIDYVGRHRLDVTIFRQLPLYVRRRVLREGRVLFARDEDLLYEIAIRTTKEFEDYRPLYRTYLEQVARGGS